jgi:hypothetical protein
MKMGSTSGHDGGGDSEGGATPHHVVDVFLVGKSRVVVSNRRLRVVDDRPCEPSD